MAPQAFSRSKNDKPSKSVSITILEKHIPSTAVAQWLWCRPEGPRSAIRTATSQAWWKHCVTGWEGAERDASPFCCFGPWNGIFFLTFFFNFVLCLDYVYFRERIVMRRTQNKSRLPLLDETTTHTRTSSEEKTPTILRYPELNPL
jgi:hypothetical protein